MKLAPIWQEIWDALAWGKPAKDKDPIHRFNRLAKEHFPNIDKWLDQNSHELMVSDTIETNR